MNTIRFCKKRDGSITNFEKYRISNAIYKAFLEANEGNRIFAQKVTETVVESIKRSYPRETPSVEDIQDIVEDTLIQYNFRKTAKRYILYRDARSRSRV